MILSNNISVGYVRVLNNDVSIIVDPQFHGGGIGTKALKLLESEAKKLKIKKLVGRVMVHNEKSAKIFENNGYKMLMYWYEKKL
jgi:RimJ/RimL family protein N-acetyltransferase